jgi:hypothetical protein
VGSGALGAQRRAWWSCWKELVDQQEAPEIDEQMQGPQFAEVIGVHIKALIAKEDLTVLPVPA